VSSDHFDLVAVSNERGKTLVRNEWLRHHAQSTVLATLLKHVKHVRAHNENGSFAHSFGQSLEGVDLFFFSSDKTESAD
jgi:hypothetical protein